MEDKKHQKKKEAKVKDSSATDSEEEKEEAQSKEENNEPKEKSKKDKKREDRSKEEKKRPLPAETKIIELENGNKISYNIHGPRHAKEARNVVCIHGIDHGAFVWKYLAKYLANHGYCVLSIDLYGRGQSRLADESKPHTAELFNQQILDTVTHPDVLFVTEKEAKEKKSFKYSFCLIGHSMGGGVSIAFAHKYPKLVKSLILIGPAGLPFDTPGVMSLLKLPFGLGAKVFQLAADQNDMMKEDFEDLEASKEAIDLVLEGTKGIYNTSEFAHTFTNSWKHFPFHSLQKEVKEVGAHKRPSLIIWGEHDELISKEKNLPLFEKAFGVSEDEGVNHHSAVIPNTKHSCFLEKPDEVNKIIYDFLDKY